MAPLALRGRGRRRGISQLFTAMVLVGIALAVSTAVGRIVAGMLQKYEPAQVAIMRVGDMEMELEGISTSSYIYRASIKLVNFGTTPYQVSGSIKILVKGTTGSGSILSCDILSFPTLRPGEVTWVTSRCVISRSTLDTLFGTTSPPGELVKANAVFLYASIRLSTGGGGLPGSPGSPGSGGGIIIL